MRSHLKAYGLNYVLRHDDTLCYCNRAALSKLYIVTKAFFTLPIETISSVRLSVHPSSSARKSEKGKKFVQISRLQSRITSRFESYPHRPHGSGNRKLCNLRLRSSLAVSISSSTLPPDHGTSCTSLRALWLTKRFPNSSRRCFLLLKVCEQKKPFPQFHHAFPLFGRESFTSCSLSENRIDGFHHM